MGFSINDNNYAEYKLIFSIIWDNEKALISQEVIEAIGKNDPISVLNELEIKDKDLAKKGLKSGLTDKISSLNHFPEKLLFDIDNQLKEKGLPTLAKLNALIKETHKKVLKNRKVRNIDEYYIIKELVIDLSSNLTLEERHLLSEYIGEFEFNKSI